MINGFIDQMGNYLCSRPVKVHMAGWESNTVKLQMEGWQMSCEIFRLASIDAQEIRIAMKHDGLRQTAFGVMHLHSYYFRRLGNHDRFFEDGFPMGIQISHLAPMIRVVEMPMPRSIYGDFKMSPFDARPEFRVAKDLNDIAFFKPIKSNSDFEIYIHEKDEQEILDILLKKQDPKQKEIRQNIKRRSYMEENGNGIRDNINTDIKHQIVLVS